MTVQTAAADDALTGLSDTITGFDSVLSTAYSFAWVTAWADSTNNNHPRGFWQFELSDQGTISLERGRDTKFD